MSNNIPTFNKGKKVRKAPPDESKGIALSSRLDQIREASAFKTSEASKKISSFVYIKKAVSNSLIGLIAIQIMPFGVNKAFANKLFTIPETSTDRKYEGGNGRGYWFTAPTDFEITGAEVWTPTPSGGKTWVNIYLINHSDPLPQWTNLMYGNQGHISTLKLSEQDLTNGSQHTFSQAVSITSGQKIGVIGMYQRDNSNTKGIGYTDTTAGSGKSISLMGSNVDFKAFGTQRAIDGATAAPDVWTTNHYLGRIELYGGAAGISGTTAISALPSNKNCNGATIFIDNSGTYSDAINTGTGCAIDSKSKLGVLSGVYSGSGSLTITESISAGKVTLSNSNTYTGTTIVENKAHLQVTGSIANSSGLTVESGGKISGSSFEVTNKTPTTTFTGGTFEAEGSNTYAKSFVSGSGGAIIDNKAYSPTLTGVFSGSGGLTLSNSGSGGSTTLSGTNTYTGATTVEDDVHLKVNGSIASSSSLSVAANGIISGIGYYPTTNLTTGAKISPGNSIGTQNFTNLNLNGGSLDIEIQGPQNDKISVTGNVTNFTGTANIIPYGGGTLWPNFNYSIINQDMNKIIAISDQRTSIKGGPYITALTLDLNSKQISGANIISDYRGVAFANYNGKCF